MNDNRRGMNYKQVVAHFGGLSKAAQVIGIKKQNIFGWGKRGRIPSKWQVKIENLTDGVLQADSESTDDALQVAALLSRRSK